MAATKIHFPGLAILAHRTTIAHLIKTNSAKSVLDYGCGRGDQYRAPYRIHRDWGLNWFHVTMYDPAFPKHDKRPSSKFDAVLCSDVLEHVPEEDLTEMVAALFYHANKFVWASVCCRPAKKTFPGTDTNVHVTLQPMQWWYQLFATVREATGKETPFYLTETP
jgi:2-polyprenyl-3-methyl-5-hydroxy-6-metoxy-1,4-benzoquinol methylase